MQCYLNQLHTYDAGYSIEQCCMAAESSCRTLQFLLSLPFKYVHPLEGSRAIACNSCVCSVQSMHPLKSHDLL